jgi:hypothetical protein
VRVEFELMTDFYSVLKSSIVRRNLRSPDDRRDIYGQARKAMINKLWSFDPPLAEDEIDTRIGLFDAAVERIESDLELAFAESDAIEVQQPRRREAPRRLPPPEPPRQPLIDEGYDEEADYVPAFGGRTAAREERQERQQPPRRDSYDEPPAPRRYDQRDEAGRQEARSEWIAPVARQPDQWEERGDEHQDDDFHADPGRDGGGHRDEHYDEAAYEEPPARETPRRTVAYQAPKYREEAASGWRPAAPQRQIDEKWESAAPTDDHDFQDEEEAYAEVEHALPGKKKKKKGRKRSGKQSASGGRSPVRILALTIAGLAAVLIAFNIYVFLPIIFGPERTTSAPAVAPPKMDDRLPADGAAAASPARIVADSATASEISERQVDVVESLVVFDGRDPTMFEGSPDNPIRFASDAEGEYAQISSATSAAGARAVIGPGLAERLAGKTVRITLLARASAENGAPSLRFAHQSGVAISPWQTAQLTDSYGTYAMIWRVPAGDSRGGDYLLIEPGIPGDGTSTDIRSIKIDILAS